MSKHDKKPAGQFNKKEKSPSAYKLAQQSHNQGPANPSATIGLNAHNKFKR